MTSEPEKYCHERRSLFCGCVDTARIHGIDTFATLDSRGSFDVTERVCVQGLGR